MKKGLSFSVSIEAYPAWGRQEKERPDAKDWTISVFLQVLFSPGEEDHWFEQLCPLLARRCGFGQPARATESQWDRGLGQEPSQPASDLSFFDRGRMERSRAVADQGAGSLEKIGISGGRDDLCGSRRHAEREVRQADGRRGKDISARSEALRSGMRW